MTRHHDPVSVFGHALAVFDPAPVRIWDPYPKQQRAAALAGEVFELLYGGAAGGGKALSLDTPVPTPTGWTTMGDLRPGDEVLDENGRPCRVTAATPPLLGRPCYRVTFDDGTEIVADAEHEWLTYTRAERAHLARRTPEYRAARRAARPSRGTGRRPDLAARNAARQSVTLPPPAGTVQETQEIARTVEDRHAVPVARPLDLPDVDLPFPPYTLGAWLGDGATAAAQITCADPEIIDEIRRDGFTVERVPSTRYGWGITVREARAAARTEALTLVVAGESIGEACRIVGLHRDALAGLVAGRAGQTRRSDPSRHRPLIEAPQTVLRRIGVLGRKHIPAAYLRAGYGQRLALLQGLMDTDGYAEPNGGAEFTTTNEDLARGVYDLACGLGLKPTIRAGRATLYGRDISAKWRVTWTSDLPVFRLPRKVSRVTGRRLRGVQRWRTITAVTLAPSVPVRCIEVDSPSRLYLASRAMIPTHNSMFIRGYAGEYALTHPGAHIAIVRRYLPMLKQTHGLHLPGLLAGHARENKSEFTFTFPNGSVIRFISLPNEGDEQNYKSAEFDLILFDEVTELGKDQYEFMLTRVRSARGHRPHVIACANPEGRGFRWVKRRWVAPQPEDLAAGQEPPTPGVPWRPPLVVDGVVKGWQQPRAFLPATVYDNPGLMASNPQYVLTLESLPDSRLRRALLDGDWNAMDQIPGALWGQDVIDDHRVESAPATLVRVVTGVDPSGSSSSGDRECGIVTVGLGADGCCYVLEDSSGSMAPDVWAATAIKVWRRHLGDKIVAERNFGGDMVASTLGHVDALVPVELVTASRGKAVRAEPIAALTRLGRIKFVGRHADLEDQLCTWTPDDSWSPDRLDAFVWAVTELMGGSAALSFLTALAAPCPECGVPNTAGRPRCVRCDARLPHAAPAVPPAGVLPDPGAERPPPGVPGAAPVIPAAPGPPPGDETGDGEPAPSPGILPGLLPSTPPRGTP